MTLCKLILAVLVAVPLLAGGTAKAQRTAAVIFDADEFWAAHPADSGAREAWRQGAKWPSGRHSFAVYHDGFIFGFTSRDVPADQDGEVRARLAKAYAERADMEALRTAGLFAFDRFQCQALAGYPEIAPGLNLCGNMKVKSKTTSVWSGLAFSVVRLAADEICACRKALDQGQGEDNAGTFFGEIARQELSRLHRDGQSQAVREFFKRHFKKKIFQASELIMAAEALAENQSPEVPVLLDAVTGRFAPDLTIGQWEKCGDLYYQAGLEGQAEQAYLKASEVLYR
jgi:hypothetical protein